MAQQPIEVILTRQLASYLATPIFVVDPDGTLVFYNEPAELVLGRRYEETGAMGASEWAALWSPTDDDGHPLPPERLPLLVALREGRPMHGELWIQSLGGPRRRISTTAFPLLGLGGQRLGAVAVFWESAA